jgi:hypothetical protein
VTQDIGDIRDFEGRLVIIPGIQEDGEMGSYLMEKLKNVIGDRPLDHVVSCFGGAVPRKPLWSMDDNDVFESAKRCLPHLRLLKILAPLLRDDPSSSYTFITGMLGERCFMPDKLTSMCLSNGLLYSLIVAFRSSCQAEGKSYRIIELRIGSMLHHSATQGDGTAGHPVIPAQAEMKSFSSDLVGNFVRKGMNGDLDGEEIIKLCDEDFRGKF